MPEVPFMEDHIVLDAVENIGCRCRSEYRACEPSHLRCRCIMGEHIVDLDGIYCEHERQILLVECLLGYLRRPIEPIQVSECAAQSKHGDAFCTRVPGIYRNIVYLTVVEIEDVLTEFAHMPAESLIVMTAEPVYPFLVVMVAVNADDIEGQGLYVLDESSVSGELRRARRRFSRRQPEEVAQADNSVMFVERALYTGFDVRAMTSQSSLARMYVGYDEYHDGASFSLPLFFLSASLTA